MMNDGNASAREVRRRIRQIGRQNRFHVFISYARDPDAALAEQLRHRLQAVGRRWWERRRIRVFLDTAEIRAGASLPAEIRDNVIGSAGLVVLASRKSAASKWVRQEVATWSAAGRRTPPILLLTDGDIAWSDANSDFEWSATSALDRQAFSKLYPTEPVWVGLRDRDITSTRWLRWLARRRLIASACVRIAATVLDVDREALARHERRRQRANVATAAVAVLMIGSLAVASSLYAAAARQQSRLKAAQHVVDAALTNRARTDMSLLLYAAAYRMAPDQHGPELLRQALANPGLYRVLRMPDGTRTNTVDAVAYSPDGQWLAGATSTGGMGERDSLVVLWRAEGDQVGVAVPVAELGVAATSVAFSPDSTRLAVGDPTGRIAVVRVPGAAAGDGRDLSAAPVAQVLATADSRDLEVRRLSFSATGDRLAASYYGGTTRIWDLQSGTEVASFAGERSVYAPDGTAIASISRQQTSSAVVVRDALSLVAARTFSGGSQTMFDDVDYRADGRTLAIAASSGAAGVWIGDSRDGGLTQVPGSSLCSVVAAGGDDLVVNDAGLVVRGSGGDASSVFRVLPVTVRGLAVRPGGEQYAVAGHWFDQSLAGSVLLFTTEPSVLAGRVIATWGGATGAASEDGREAALTSEEGLVKRVSTLTGESVGPALAAGVRSPTALSYSPQGTLLAGINGRHITVWSLVDGRAMEVHLPATGLPAQAGTHLPSGLAFHPDGRRLVTAAPDGSVEVLRVDDGSLTRLTRLLPGAIVTNAAFAPDGRELALATNEGVQLWDVTTWKRRQVLGAGGGAATAVAYGSASQLVSSDGQRLTIWDVRTGQGEVVANPYAGVDQISHLAVSAKTDTAATATSGGAVVVWDLANKKRLPGTLLASAPMSSIALSVDGRTLTASGSAVTQWNLDPEYWLEWICDVVRRNLDVAEWQTYGSGARPRVCVRFAW